MKTQFPGYFALSKPRIKKLWDEAVFVFDANILLGLYRYSDATRKEFFSTLDAIKDRCWLPHQAVKEYFDNRLSVIGKQEEAYAEIARSMDEIEKKFKNAHQHPFLSVKILDRLCSDFEVARKELNKSKSFHTNRINSDDVLIEIEKIFRDRVGLAYEEEQLSAILIEGEERYQKSIPPGFRDAKKDDSGNSARKYGDLILWKQILDKATTDKVGIVFVCDDRKDDWWLQFKGKTLGPRPELVKEFMGVGGTDLHMYSSDRFLEFAGEHFDRVVSEVAVSEMRELKRFDEEHRRRAIDAHIRRRERDARRSQLEAEQMHLVREIKENTTQRSAMEKSRQILSKRLSAEDPTALTQTDYEQLEQLANKSGELNSRAQFLLDRIRKLDLEKERL